MRFSADFRPKFSKFFGGRKNFRSKSREIAPKSMPAGDAQLPQDHLRSPTSKPSVSMLRRVRLRAVLSGFPTEIFRNFSAAAKFFVRNGVRSHRNPCQLMVRSLLTTLGGPQHLCRASACCGACNGVPIYYVEKINMHGRDI